MKITKSYLKQIIKEELGAMQTSNNDVMAKSVEEFPGGYIVTVRYNGKSRSVTVPKNNPQGASLSDTFKREVPDPQVQQKIKDIAIAKVQEVGKV